MPETTGEIVENQINPDKIGFLAPVDENNNPLIPIFVKGLDGKTMTAQVTKNAFIFEIMEQVAQKTGIPVLDQRLQFGGKQLDSSLRLTDYALQKENTLHLSARLQGGIGEHKVISDFIAAKIKHSNVNGLKDKNSRAAINFMRGNEGTQLVQSIIKGTVFKQGYEHPMMQDTCAVAIMVEEMQAGNCTEMSMWTAVQLIENTQGQWVHVAGLTGKFPIDKKLNQQDANHPLYKNYLKGLDDGLDHVLVITYPDNTPIHQMDPDKATVVDTWYDHLVCSLSDYMNSLHPYYNYEYSSDKAFKLKQNNFISQRCCQTIGQPFSDYKNVGKQLAKLKKKKVDMNVPKGPVQLSKSKYTFDITGVVNEQRSTKNLENLLVEANKQGLAAQEIATFMEDAYQKIAESTQDNVLTILYSTIENGSFDLMMEFAPVLAKASQQAIDNFCRLASPSMLKKFFNFQFFDYDDEATLSDFIDAIFANSTAQKTRVLTNLPAGQFKYYLFYSTAHFQDILSIGALKETIKTCLNHNDTTNENWTALWNKCDNNTVKAIIQSLIQLHKETGEKALITVPNDKVPVLE